MQRFESNFITCIKRSSNSAVSLVHLLARNFSCFRDEHSYHGRTVQILKRAQILVADLWACFNGEGYGEFHDIDQITIFAGQYPDVVLSCPHPAEVAYLSQITVFRKCCTRLGAFRIAVRSRTTSGSAKQLKLAANWRSSSAATVFGQFSYF